MSYISDFVSVFSVHCREDNMKIKFRFLALRYMGDLSLAVIKQLKERGFILTLDLKLRQEELEEAGHIGCSYINQHNQDTLTDNPRSLSPR